MSTHRLASTYRANKANPKRVKRHAYSPLISMRRMREMSYPLTANRLDMSGDRQATEPVKATVYDRHGYTSHRSPGCIKACDGKPHQHRRECERRLRQAARTVAKGAAA